MLYNCLIHKRSHILHEIIIFFLKVVKRLCEMHKVHMYVFSLRAYLL
jgi:hypothetical protein